MKEGIPDEPCEDDLMLSTRAEAKFFNHLQLGDAVFQRTQELPEGTTKLMLMQESIEGDIRYQQTEVFFYGCQRC